MRGHVLHFLERRGRVSAVAMTIKLLAITPQPSQRSIPGSPRLRHRSNARARRK